MEKDVPKAFADGMSKNAVIVVRLPALKNEPLTVQSLRIEIAATTKSDRERKCK